jgi:hypothetical protein
VDLNEFIMYKVSIEFVLLFIGKSLFITKSVITRLLCHLFLKQMTAVCMFCKNISTSVVLKHFLVQVTYFLKSLHMSNLNAMQYHISNQCVLRFKFFSSQILMLFSLKS